MDFMNLMNFSKFIGEEVEIIDIDDVITKNPIFIQIEHQALKDGLVVGYWLPGTIVTAEYRANRINVNLQKTNDKPNVYTICTFNIG